MIVRVASQPLTDRSDKVVRLIGVGAISLGIAALSVWNPLTLPGPTVCMLRKAFGLPCPACGMTRGVALCLRGHVHDGSAFNPLSFFVLVVATLFALKWGLELAMGRRYRVIARSWLWRSMTGFLSFLVLANWIYLLIYRREDPFAETWLGQLLAAWKK